ncbi:MAG: hypothetical protein O4859_05280, partial [Trichodesmium sp. St18_bin1]|nr:hypothetical protein [Trichodesmium sp. St18_bin1]
LPGNQLFSNTGKVVQSTDSAIQWDASQLDFNTFVNGPIPNRDLLGVGSRNTPGACALVPGCKVVGHSNPFFGTPQVANWDTVDNGDNVLDGFVITVDDFNEYEVISFNWDLLNVAGKRIGDTNDYGFGAVNIARIPIHEDSHAEDSHADFRVFEQNTGVERSDRLFAEKSYLVTEFSPANFDTTLDRDFSARNAIATETNDSTGEEQLIAMFAAEFGAGITGPFLNPEDNIFNSPVNAKLVNNPTNNGSGSSGPGSSGSGSSGSDSSGSDSSGSGSSGSDSSGSDSSGSGSSGSGSSGSGSSGSDSSGSGSSGSGSSGSGSSGSGSSGSGSSDGIRTSVPEPSIIAMLGMTAIAIFGYKRQRPN